MDGPCWFPALAEGQSYLIEIGDPGQAAKGGTNVGEPSCDGLPRGPGPKGKPALQLVDGLAGTKPGRQRHLLLCESEAQPDGP